MRMRYRCISLTGLAGVVCTLPVWLTGCAGEETQFQDFVVDFLRHALAAWLL